MQCFCAYIFVEILLSISSWNFCAGEKTENIAICFENYMEKTSFTIGLFNNYITPREWVALIEIGLSLC